MKIMTGSIKEIIIIKSLVKYNQRKNLIYNQNQYSLHIQMVLALQEMHGFIILIKPIFLIMFKAQLIIIMN